jgi:hypothetical protein
MDYLVALPPELGLSADEFAISWNETRECRSLAEAIHFELTGPSSEVFTGEVVTLRNVDESVDTDAIRNLIKQALYGQGITAGIEISPMELPENARLFVVRSADS